MTPNFSTPSTDYRMPAEWEPHAATWLTWPHDEAHFPGKLDTIHPVYAKMIKELEQSEDVHILINDEKIEDVAKKAMKDAGVQGDRVHLHRVPTNFSWTRDHGPIFVKNDVTGKMMIT